MDYLWMLIAFLLGLFGNGLLSYIKQKGKNVADIEDRERIKTIEEDVRKLTEMELHSHSNKVDFDWDYNFEQYSKLYANLYSIVTQSEFLRFIHLNNNPKIGNFDEFPFLEIRNYRQNTTSNLFTREQIENKTEEIIDGITSFNKRQLVDYIIDNNAYASQELLKLAVSYRYALKNYSGNKTLDNTDMQDKFDNLEIDLIHAIVTLIIKEYNLIRKRLGLEYNETELEEGRLNAEIFDYKRYQEEFVS